MNAPTVINYLNQLWAESNSWMLLFCMYSFLGWLIEVLYRSWRQKRFVNAGFLYGPLVPIYGIGALLIVWTDAALVDMNILVRVLFYGFGLSTLEYITGFFSEKIFRLKLWDYSDTPLNLHGRVALPFVGLWVVFAYTLNAFLHPFISGSFATVSLPVLHFGSVVVFIYFVFDCIFSLLALTALRGKIAYLYAQYISLDIHEVEKIFSSFERLTRAFPYLNKQIQESMHSSIKQRAGALLDEVSSKILSKISLSESDSDEYGAISANILSNKDFQRLDTFRHHDCSILEHVKKVALLSYRMAKYLNLDFVSATRGALLHDFFLYDWRNHDVPDLPKEKFHGFAHPVIALKNAEKHFEINDIERDIIIKHMWPLTLTPPRYKESFIVTLADKIVSTRESAAMLTNHIRKNGRIQNGSSKKTKIKKGIKNL